MSGRVNSSLEAFLLDDGESGREIVSSPSSYPVAGFRLDFFGLFSLGRDLSKGCSENDLTNAEARQNAAARRALAEVLSQVFQIVDFRFS
jgi:hypothetical protein